MWKALLSVGLLLVGGGAEKDLDYYDRLRGSLAADPSVPFSAPSVLNFLPNNNLFDVPDAQEGSRLLLASFATFLPLSEGLAEIRPAVLSDALMALLALHHVNNPELLPDFFAWKTEFQDKCNVKITSPISNTAYSPIISTRLFTTMLQRSHELATPLPAGVVGAYRSAVTSPLAILTGVNNIPQVAYAATSTDFNVKEQYPLFGRTCQSALGEAAVSVDYFHTYLKATHVGIMFVTDSFGSALQKAFQDTASQYNITTDSVAFSFTANADEIASSVRSLKATDYRQFYVICFETHYPSIMKAAYDEGIVGDEFVWIFDGFGPETFHETLVFEQDSALAKATNGIGVFSTSGGLRDQMVPHPDQDDTPPPVQETPLSGHEAIRKLYREAAQNDTFVDYLISKLPLEDLPEDFDVESFQPRLEPTSWGSFIYDAVVTLSLAYCRAVANTTTVANLTGFDVYDHFKVLDIQGATGRVQIDPDTGTRNYTTLGRTLHNFRFGNVDPSGNQYFNAYPTHHYQDGTWTKQADFVYADGGKETPPSLPEPDVNMNYIGKMGRAVGYTLMVLAMICSLIGITWLLIFWKERVVSASQPLFLIMVAVGSFVTTSAIVPLSLEETIVTNDNGGLDVACQVSPWLYLSGMVLMLSALLAKTRGVHQAYANPDLEFIHITSCDIICTFFALFGINLVVMIPWSIISPLEWDRVDKDSTDMFDRPVESFGTCSDDNATPFLIVAVILNVFIVGVGNWWAYQSRNIETEYHESRYIGIALASILQAWLMGIPILIVVSDNPQARFFVQAGIIFVTAVAALLLVYVPKMLAVKTDRLKVEEESKRLAYTTFKSESQRKGFGIEDPDDDDDEANDGAAPEMTRSPALKTDSSVRVVANVSGKDEKEKSSGAEMEESGTPAVSDDSGLSVPSMAAAAAEAVSEYRRGSSRNLQRQRSLGLLGAATASFRNSSKSFKLNKSASFQFDGADDNVGRIKVLHNPRSARNLSISGGMEVSRRQLEILEDIGDEHYDEDDAIIEEEPSGREDVDDIEEPRCHQPLPLTLGQKLGPVLETSTELLKPIADGNETEATDVAKEDATTTKEDEDPILENEEQTWAEESEAETIDVVKEDEKTMTAGTELTSDAENEEERRNVENEDASKIDADGKETEIPHAAKDADLTVKSSNASDIDQTVARLPSQELCVGSNGEGEAVVKETMPEDGGDGLRDCEHLIEMTQDEHSDKHIADEPNPQDTDGDIARYSSGVAEIVES